MTDEEKSDKIEGMSREAADELARAKAKVALAEAKKLENEAKEAGFKAEVQRFARDKAEIEHKKAMETEERRLQGDYFHHVYRFDKIVGEASVHEAIGELTEWSRLDPGCEMLIIFCSPGGDVISGMAFFDFLEQLKREGHRVVTRAEGYAASMAGILLQAGTVRQCGAESYILIHEIATAVRGKVGDIEDEMIFIKKISDRILNIFARRAKEAGEKGTASEPLSKRKFANGWSRKDWWLTSEEALRWGVVDEVV